MANEEGNGSELVIIRRRSAFAEADFNGGVWKIAYADFMTALMAFFLVMWLIHAVDQETRESVASYFNPVKLAERTPDKKGVDDPQKKEPSKAVEADSAKPAPESRAPPAPPAPSADDAARAPRYEETTLFRDPYAVLTEIAGTPSPQPSRERRIGATLGPEKLQGAKGAQAYRDPFDPIYWQLAPKAPVESRSRRASGGSIPSDEDIAALVDGEERRPSDGSLDATVVPPPSARVDRDSSPPDLQALSRGQQPTLSPPQASPRQQTSLQPSRTDAAPPQPIAAVARDAANDPARPASAGAETKPVEDKPAAIAPAAAETRPVVAGSLQAAIRAALASDPTPGPVVEVRQTDEGVLVSLTDAANFGMFAIGSAEPQPELVRTIDRIAPLIAKVPGVVVVRGHTDGRPFRSPNYDNWRLSTARAHMAFHMLIRGGIEQKAIERIEGYADKRLKRPDDPLAPQNRRIEILVRGPQP
jgi:chemotaxis protein MotB